MNNGDMPASPVIDDAWAKESAENVKEILSVFGGLTKREAFAMAAMQGLLADGSRTDVLMADGSIAVVAVQQADALLKSLENNNEL